MPIQVLYLDQSFHRVVAWLAERFPELTIVVDHLGHVPPNPALGADIGADLVALAKYPNIHVKMSLQYLISKESFPWADMRPLQERLLASFGA